MSKYVMLSLIDAGMVKEMKPILDYADYYEYVREIHRDPRPGTISDGLMDILDVTYDNEQDFHVLTPELIERIIKGLEERQGEWTEGIQYKSKRLISALQEQHDTFAFESGDSLLLSWSD